MKKEHDLAKKQNRYVFLDDIRYPKDAYYYTKNPIYVEKEWIIVRNYDEFVNDILDNGLSYCYSFDHDLADEHYGSHLKKNIYYSEYKEKTGFACAQWLVNHCLEHGHKVPRYIIHSMNVPGSINIDSYIKTFLKYEDQLR